jgi:hypothetical protein
MAALSMAGGLQVGNGRRRIRPGRHLIHEARNDASERPRGASLLRISAAR